MRGRTAGKAVRTRPLPVRPAVAALFPALLWLGGARPAAAQGWSVEAQAGRLRYDAGAGDIRSSSVVAGAGYTSAARWLRALGGLPFSSQEPVWGALVAGVRPQAAAGSVRFGLDLSGSAFLEQDRRAPAPPDQGGGLLGGLLPDPTQPPAPGTSGHALAGQAGAFLGAGTGSVRFEALGAAARYHARLGELRRDRTVPLADARVLLTPAPALALAAGARRYFAPEGGATRAQLTGTWVRAGGSAWASVGQWLGAPGGAGGTDWGLGTTLRVSGPLELTADARRDTFDPLYLTVARTSWSAGLRLRLGRLPAPTRAPVPAHYEGGKATIALAAAEALGTPRVAGDFNGWKPQPMERAGGEWHFAAPVRPGVYYYAFVAPDGHWYVPRSVAGRRDDGMGGEVAVLVVR